MGEECSGHGCWAGRLPHADAMGCDGVCRVQRQRAMAAAEQECGPGERRHGASGLCVHAELAPGADRAAPRAAELSLGTYKLVSVAGDLLVFERAHQGRRLLVALNLGVASASLAAHGRILLSTFMDRQAEEIDGSLSLRGAEGIILKPSA